MMAGDPNLFMACRITFFFFKGMKKREKSSRGWWCPLITWWWGLLLINPSSSNICRRSVICSLEYHGTKREKKCTRHPPGTHTGRLSSTEREKRRKKISSAVVMNFEPTRVGLSRYTGNERGGTWQGGSKVHYQVRDELLLPLIEATSIT